MSRRGGADRVDKADGADKDERAIIVRTSRRIGFLEDRGELSEWSEGPPTNGRWQA